MCTVVARAVVNHDDLVRGVNLLTRGTQAGIEFNVVVPDGHDDAQRQPPGLGGRTGKFGPGHPSMLNI